MTTFYVIRHGETDFNSSGRFQGQTDIPLNALGKLQAGRLAPRLARLGLEAIYASDLSRTLETARIIAGDLPLFTDRRLREIDVGECARCSWEEVKLRFPDFYAAFRQAPAATPFPGGESFLQQQARVTEAMSELALRHPEGRIAVVTHGGAIRCLVAAVIELPLDRRSRLAADNCGLTRIDWTGDRRTLVFYNDVSHLADA